MASSDRIQLPWQEDGWFSRENELRNKWREIEKFLRGVPGLERGPLPVFKRTTPGTQLTILPNNPYAAVVIGLAFLALPVFFLIQIGGVWAVVLSIPFVLGSVVGVGFGVYQVPRWHLARRAVKQYLAEHPGTFPPDLRWYS